MTRAPALSFGLPFPPPAHANSPKAAAKITPTTNSSAHHASDGSYGGDRLGVGQRYLSAPIFISVIGLWRMGRRLPRIVGGSWAHLSRELTLEMKLKRPVVLLRGGPKAMPMTWGFFRPKLLLPPKPKTGRGAPPRRDDA